LETKFEYQVSPELAEKIAIEQFEVLLRMRWIKLKFLPLVMSCLFALLFFCLSVIINLNYSDYTYGPPGSYFRIGGTAYAFNESSVFIPIGFALGFGFGVLINSFIRWRILATARSAYAKMGPTRIVSWNHESITFRSPVYETKVHWEMIDRIEVGYFGVYGLSGRRAFFAIPKDAFPPNATTEELTRTWQNHRMQP